MEDGDNPFDLDDVMNLDIDSFCSSSRSPTRPPRFQPKLKGKIKKQEADEPSQDQSGALTVTRGAEAPASNPMEEDDEVVREIDVFCNPPPLDKDAQLYVMQYPLRPNWRPYGLSDRCEEVRVKPKQSDIEVVLDMDVDSTLSSAPLSSVTDCAVGILIRNQLHLNPVHAVVQLRPSMKTLNDAEVQKKHTSLEVSTKTDKGKRVAEDTNQNMRDAEPWVSLKYNAIDSPCSCRYRHKMMAQGIDPIKFMMKPSDYLSSLCPGTPTHKKEVLSPLRFFQTLPLEERLRKWLSEVQQVNRFAFLLHLSSTHSTEDLLKVLQCHAYLVQGLWICKSSLLYTDRDATRRDYILSLFRKNRVIDYKKLKELKVNPADEKNSILSPLAYQRSSLKDWKLKEPTDLSFIKDHPHIVNEQECAWSIREKQLLDSLRWEGEKIPAITKNSSNSNMAKGTTASGKVDPFSKRSEDGAGRSPAIAMANETRDSISKAVFEIFSDRKARSIDSIVRELREMALSRSSRPKEDPKSKALVNAATSAISATRQDLISIINQVAVQVHNLYVLKSGANPALDPLRNVIIKLFRDKKRNAKLKMQEIKDAVKDGLKSAISDADYTQVLSELCIHSKGEWILRSDDPNTMRIV